MTVVVTPPLPLSGCNFVPCTDAGIFIVNGYVFDSLGTRRLVEERFLTVWVLYEGISTTSALYEG